MKIRRLNWEGTRVVGHKKHFKVRGHLGAKIDAIGILIPAAKANVFSREYLHTIRGVCTLHGTKRVETLVLARHKTHRAITVTVAATRLVFFARIVGRVAVSCERRVGCQDTGNRCASDAHLEKCCAALAAIVFFGDVRAAALAKECTVGVPTRAVDEDQHWMVDHAVNVDDRQVNVERISLRLAVIETDRIWTVDGLAAGSVENSLDDFSAAVLLKVEIQVGGELGRERESTRRVKGCHANFLAGFDVFTFRRKVARGTYGGSSVGKALAA